MKKETLISTVLNEEKNIEYFINSIINQTKKPKEFIIVDGGSEDKTFDILKKIAKKNKWIKLYQIRGLNISEGRNYAIKKAKGEIIITCDAGGKFKKDWLEKMLQGFNGEVGFQFFKIRLHNAGFVVDCKYNLIHTHFCKALNNMFNYWLLMYRYERFW